MIHYIRGDATKPIGDGHKIIVHICNDLGRWGKGFVMAISRRWKEPEQAYREWYNDTRRLGGLKLAKIQVVSVTDDITIINMIAQRGLKTTNGIPPIRYDALTTCLEEVARYAGQYPFNAVSVHMPRIGCGLAGGKWTDIEPIIVSTLSSYEVFVYDPLIRSNFVMRFKIRFQIKEIPYWADRYQYPTESVANAVSARVRGAQFIEKDDFLILCKWKSPRIIKHCMKNSSEFIKEVTRVAFRTNYERLRIEILTLLDGVSWPTASVILHFGHKDPYPIMDYRALWSLGIEKPPNKYSFDFWWEYTQCCRKLSSQTNVSMRDLDKALWQYSKENQGIASTPEPHKMLPVGPWKKPPKNIIRLPHGGKGSAFPIEHLVSYINSMNRDYIVQGGVNCRLVNHPKPHSLDYWLRLNYAANKDTKQAVNSVMKELLDTGIFIIDKDLVCPDSGHLCKGLKLIR